MPSSSSNALANSVRRSSHRGPVGITLAGFAVALAASLAGAVDLEVTDLAVGEPAVHEEAAAELVLQAADGTIVTDEEAVADDGGAIEQVAAAADSCRESDDDCREALRSLRDDRIGDIDLDIRVGGKPGNDYPCECRLEGETFRPRKFACTTFTWKAAGYCHKPLYFEDWNLERYGHSHGWADPIISGAHFFATLPVLPYKMGVELPWECVYPLGYYRPGSCAPWTVPAVPISKRGLVLEAATVTGLVFLIP